MIKVKYSLRKIKKEKILFFQILKMKIFQKLFFVINVEKDIHLNYVGLQIKKMILC